MRRLQLPFFGKEGLGIMSRYSRVCHPWLVESPPLISLAISEGLETEQLRIVAEHVFGNQGEINPIFNRIRNFVKTPAVLAIV
jgi:hypothetical protein